MSACINRMPKRLLPLLLLLFPTFASADCECLWQGPFTQVQANTDLVISATVISGRGNSIDLTVQRILRGTLHRDDIRVWLDSADLCRAKAGTFPDGSQWIMALDRIDTVVVGGFNPSTPNISYGRVGDYSISRCGGYWLSQNEKLVSGNLTGGARWEMEPKMSPVLLELVAGYVAGTLGESTLKEAGRVDPELQQLILETRLHLRNQ
jgi:hypothetical protein